MNFEDFLKRIEALSPDLRLDAVRIYLKGIEDPEERSRAELLLLFAEQIGIAPEQKMVIVSIHGIRTHGVWQESLAQKIRSKSSAEVITIGYDYFDLLRFILPFTRQKPVAKITREIRTILALHPNSRVSIVAHSFGTYILSKILENEPDIKLNRIHLCGSIISTYFRWDKVKPQINGTILNDVGSKDVWPVMARSLSWGYGHSGTFGFKTTHVTDRFFDYGHSDFLTNKHFNKFLIPFILDGEIRKSRWTEQRPNPPIWMSFISFVPLKSIVAVVFITGVFIALLGA